MQSADTELELIDIGPCSAIPLSLAVIRSNCTLPIGAASNVEKEKGPK